MCVNGLGDDPVDLFIVRNLEHLLPIFAQCRAIRFAKCKAPPSLLHSPIASMPIVRHRDRRTMHEHRISIIGTSGAGKTTVASRVAQKLGIAHIELDALRHGPNWTEMPDDELRRRVSECIASPNWVIDGNYSAVRELVWQRVTTVVWVDPPHWRIMTQVIGRSISRAVTQQELWNGNRERVRSWLNADHPIWWALRTHTARQAKFEALMQPNWIRLRSRADVESWLASLSASA